MPKTAYVNGRYVPHGEASVHVEDRGFQFADSVYEVIGVINGDFADMRGHLDRLERSLSELRIDMPVRRAVIPFIVRELLRRNRLRNANVYIQITRGAAPRDFAFPKKPVVPTFVMTARPFSFDAKRIEDKGVRVVTLPDRRWARRDIKTTNLLPPVLAKQEALDAGADDAWLVDREGFVTEATASNAWILTKDGVLVTRAPTHDILKGVTRSAILPLLEAEGLYLEERAFTPLEAVEAAEAFSTSATALVTPVVAIDGRTIGDGKAGPLTVKLYKAYRDYVRKGLDGQIGWSA
ncbi:MAG: D-amino-acid transaminase [Alphaproteobacteria bacterium]|nr:D-amino-acid transaminase [Alphaproteobacteria bacterium]